MKQTKEAKPVTLNELERVNLKLQKRIVAIEYILNEATKAILNQTKFSIKLKERIETLEYTNEELMKVIKDMMIREKELSEMLVILMEE